MKKRDERHRRYMSIKLKEWILVDVLKAVKLNPVKIESLDIADC